MTPKEKTENLINKFIVKECALFVVNEIIDEIKIGKRMDWIHERKDGEEFLVYWYAVKESLFN